MNIAIRYYTKTGNTKKLADAIGEVTGIKAETVDVPMQDEIDILFLGSSVYAAGVDSEVKNFIKSLKGKKIGKVVNFSTAALLPSTYKQVEKLLNKEGITLDEKEYHCKGSFQMMYKGKPDANDLDAVRSFAQEVITENR